MSKDMIWFGQGSNMFWGNTAEHLQWPVLLILLFWRKSNPPIVGIVSKIKPESKQVSIKFGVDDYVR